jgi:hypothetical protein
MKKINFLIAAVLMLAFTSCASTSNYMSGLQNLTEDAQQYGSNYTIKDWQRSNDRFVKYVKKYPDYAKKLTTQERKDAMRMGTAYVAAATKYGGESITSELKGLMESGTDLISTFKDMFNGFGLFK